MASSRRPQADGLWPQADSLKHTASNKQDEGGRWPQAATTRDDLKQISDGLKQIGDGLKETGDGLKQKVSSRQPQADGLWPQADSLKHSALNKQEDGRWFQAALNYNSSFFNFCFIDT